MKKWICFLLVVTMGLLCMGCFDNNITGTEPTKPTLSAEERENLRQYFAELTRTYTPGEDGTTVTVTVPDFVALIEKLPEGTDAALVTADQWKQLAEENPQLVKEYVLTVETVHQRVVFEKLWDTIALELFVAAVGEMEFDFSDPATRGEAAE